MKITSEEWRTEVKRVSELVPAKLFDGKAETVRELTLLWSCSYATAYKKAQSLVEQGKAEKVWKHAKPRAIPAYRVKKCR